MRFQKLRLNPRSRRLLLLYVSKAIFRGDAVRRAVLQIIRYGVLRHNFIVHEPVHKHIERVLVGIAVIVYVIITDAKIIRKQIALGNIRGKSAVRNERTNALRVCLVLGIACERIRDIYFRYDLRQIFLGIYNQKVTARRAYRKRKREECCSRFFQCVFFVHKTAPIVYRNLTFQGVRKSSSPFTSHAVNLYYNRFSSKVQTFFTIIL